MMNIFDVTNTSLIQAIPVPSDLEFRQRFVDLRVPVVLESMWTALPFLRQWNMEHFRNCLKTIRVHAPDSDGVYHFLSYRRVPMDQFEANLAGEKTMYSLEPLIGRGAPQGDTAHRHCDIDEAAVPSFIPRDRLRVSNLYVGPGGNKTLLHYDEVHSLLIMLEGEKQFVVFGPEQTKYLYPYHAFNIRSILQHRVLDSKINPVSIDTRRFPRLQRAVGYHGLLKPGQALFIPAGTWHYIESEAPNVAVNYFWHQGKLGHWLSRPLLDFWLKRRQIQLIDLARRVRNSIRKPDNVAH